MKPRWMEYRSNRITKTPSLSGFHGYNASRIMTDPFPYQRLVVIGVTGSGKSTLAGRLAALLNLACIDLDALHWDPNWTEAPVEVFRSRVETATRSGRWVAAGNYHVVRDLIWPRAEAALWLDYSLPLVCLLVRRCASWLAGGTTIFEVLNVPEPITCGSRPPGRRS